MAAFPDTTEPVLNPQTITFISVPPDYAVVGGTPYVVSATGGQSGNPVIFSIDAAATTVCTIAGTTVTFTAAGTCVIDANQAGNASYADAPQMQQSFAVAQGVPLIPQTISFTSTPPPSAIVDGPSYIVTATGGGSGNPVTFAIDVSASAVCAISGASVVLNGAGTCVIDANQAGNENYEAAAQAQQSFTVAKASQTITFSSTPPSPAVFGGSYIPAATGGRSGNPVVFTVPASSSACSLTSGTVIFTGTGTCIVDADQTGNANYFPAPTAFQNFSVSKASTAVVLTFSSIAAPPPAWRLAFTFTATVTSPAGLPASGTVTFRDSKKTLATVPLSPSGAAVLTTAALNKGTHAISADYSGNNNLLGSSSDTATITIK